MTTPRPGYPKPGRYERHCAGRLPDSDSNVRLDAGDVPDVAAARARMIERQNSEWRMPTQSGARTAASQRLDAGDAPDPAAARQRMIERDSRAWRGDSADESPAASEQVFRLDADPGYSGHFDAKETAALLDKHGNEWIDTPNGPKHKVSLASYQARMSRT